jgi:threonine dehydratase
VPTPPMITRTDVEEAAERVGGRVRRTPVVEVEPDALGTPASALLKLELLQHTGSFKPRGIFNRILSARADAKAHGVIAASGGNAGLAVAYAAEQLGLHAEIFVPVSASPVKVARLRKLGAVVNVTGAHYADAFAASQERAATTGALVVHAYDQPEVAAGQGTLARELLEQAPAVDTVLVAVGGGGLIAGVATWLRGRARVVAVEPERCPTMAAALERGEPVDVEVGGIAIDSLGARRVSDTALRACQRAGAVSVLVSDEAIAAARLRLWERLRVAAEPGGACAVAALSCGAYRPAPGERVAAIVCGGNTDPADLEPRPEPR